MEDIWRWNSEVPRTVEQCVHNLISERVQEHPLAPAIFASDGELTYQQLDSLSDNLAHSLAQVVRSPSIIPLCFEKSMWTVVAVLAVLKTGSAFVLLDTSQPEARLRSVVQQTQSPLICSSVRAFELSARIAGKTAEVLVVSPDLFGKNQVTNGVTNGVTHISSKSDPSAPCYVVFTSGSTGVPKGVIVSHSNICTAFHYQLKDLGFTSKSRVFDFASYSFDVAVHNVLGTLVSGACLCIPSDNERIQDPAGAMAAMNVTLANLTPSVARLIDPQRVPYLETLIFLGEALSRDEAQRWRGSTRTINTYGPAECTPISTINASMHVVSETEDPSIGSGSGTITWVVDPEDSDILLPPGEIGELLLEGPLVGSGYLNDPKKTADAFIDSPTWLKPNRQSKCYKTGDLVTYDRNGSLRFMGRKDTQVKISGQRVELGEIEHHVLACFKNAFQVVVELVQIQANTAIVAFLQFMDHVDHGDKDGVDENGIAVFNPDIKDINEISLRLTKSILPTLYFSVTSIPYTASGKTDRKRLREIGSSIIKNRAAEGSKRQPKSEMERKLQLLWAEVLGLDPGTIGLDDEFLSLGGHSLAAIKLAGAARESGIHLQVVDIFERGTLEDQARVAKWATAEQPIPQFSLVDSTLNREELASLCNSNMSAIHDAYPCTSLQEGLISLSMQNSNDYVIQIICDVSDLDLEAIKAAWAACYTTTGSLRTRIVQTYTRLVQVVMDENITWLSSCDLQSYLVQDKSTPFELGGRLSRFAVMSGNDPNHAETIVITLHHAIYDLWSLDLLKDKVRDLYLCRPRSGPFAPGFNSFVKYVEEVKHGGAADEYWRSALGDAESIPFPEPDPTKESPFGLGKLEWSFGLPPRAAQTTEATQSILLRAALAILLAHNSNSRDVVFGSTVSGRNASVSGVDRTIGPTIATVPVRVRLTNGEKTISELLSEMQAQATGMMPFEQLGLQHISKLGDGPKKACEFQTLLVVQPYEDEVDDTSFGKWEAETEQISTYALTLECFLAPESIKIKANFNSAAIEPWRLEKTLEQLDLIVNQLTDIRNGTMPLKKINVLPEAHLNQIGRWNSEVPDFVDRCLHGLIHEQVERQPVNHLAVRSWDGTSTYSELNTYSNRFAKHLTVLGVEPGDFIPICFDKSLITVVVMLAVLKAGAAFVPIEPSLSATRRQGILDEIEARFVLTSDQQSTLFADSACDTRIVTMELLQNLPYGGVDSIIPQKPSSPAYIIFTSGTTGRPKGVVMEHRAASSSCIAHGRALGFHSTSRVLQFSSYTFDACIAEIFTTLIWGGCICVPSEGDRLSNLAGAITEMDVNWVFLTPAVARLVDPPAVECVKTIAIGGEKFSNADARRWIKPGRRVMLVYGPTETCVYCTGHDLSKGVDSRLIGKPIGSVAWLVNPNDHNQLAPLGSVGELLVEGPILAREYLKDQDKTASSFVRDLQWFTPGGSGFSAKRCYKTGDLVQYTSAGDGSLRYVGRKDNQIKLRGMRLELADVEHHVLDCIPDAQHVVAAIISVGEHEGNDALAAFIQMDHKSSPGDDQETVPSAQAMSLLALPSEVLYQISQRLSNYMTPSYYFSVAGVMPRMASSGKTDRNRLREIGTLILKEHSNNKDNLTTKRQPSSSREVKVQTLWADVLNISNQALIGLDDSFFELGGDSILAMKLVSEARKKGIGLSVANVFRAPTLAAQSRLYIETVKDDGDFIEPFSLLGRVVDAQLLCDDLAMSYGAVDARKIEDLYPCTPLQLGLLSLASRQSGDYILQNVWRLAHDIRLEAFQEAWGEAFKRLPILRTRILQHAELGFLQAVLRGEIEWIQSEDDLESFLKKDKTSPMDLGDPLFRFALLGDATRPHSFVWTAHHSCYDGWTMNLITNLVNQIYQNKSPVGHTPSFNTFVKYVEEQKGLEADTYWREAFEGVEAPTFPSLPPHIREASSDMTSEHDCDLFEEGFHLSSREITISTIIRAALAIVMGHHTNSSEVLFGAVLSGRNAPVAAVTHLFGPTISTVPLRIELGAESSGTAKAFLQSVQRQATEMMAFEQTGLQNIAKLSKDAHNACQFQTLLVVQTDDDEIPVEEAFGTRWIHDQLGFTTYAITLESIPTPCGVRLRAQFDSAVINAWRIDCILGQLHHVMNQLIAASEDNDKQLASVDLLSPLDETTLNRWNGAPPNKAVERCVHEMIRKQAQTRPTDTAIFGWDDDFTYRDLDEWSDRLGDYLASLGVGPEVIVPLCFAKSSWTIVAMISVMKSGGAFVLLDPSHPSERLRMLCEKTNANIAIASPMTAAKVDSFVQTVLILDNDTKDFLPRRQDFIMRGSPTNTAYVIFTSGSTGVPKGCLIEHRSYCSTAVNHGYMMNMSSSTRSLQFGSYSFAGAIMEILMTLLHGGCICVPSDEERSTQLDQAICRLDANWAFLTSSVLSSLSPEMVPCLRTICIGGEAIHAAQIPQWSRSVHLRQTYGSAETAAVVSSAHLQEDANTSDVGRPTTGRYWIVDAADVSRLAPLGASGEVIIEGPVIGREYLDDIEKTAAAFIHPPAWRNRFGIPEPGSRFYKTGDIGMYTPEGALQLLGRKDSQVKLRGQRIELGEIEHQGRSATGDVSEFAVELAIPNDADTKASMLVAFIVLRKADEADFTPEAGDKRSRLVSSTIREKLQSVLPQYYVPSVYLVMPEMPKTISKKTDRKRLREMASSYTRQELLKMGSLDEGYKRQPTTQREKKLQVLWSQTLGVEAESIGLDDDFFQVGGDSIIALKLVSEARKSGFTLSMADVFKHRNLTSQARLDIDASSKASILPFSLLGQNGNELERLRGELAQSCGVDRRQVENAYPCTPIQVGLFSLSLKSAGDYVLQSVLEVSKDVDLEKFKWAWSQTVSAVATLRTRIVHHSDFGHLQVVVDQETVWESAAENDLKAFLTRDKLRDVDFGQSLSRFTLGMSNEGHQWFVWTIHHSLFDGWSMPLVINVVKDAYLNETIPGRKEFTPFVKYIQEMDHDEAETFWSSTLAGYDSQPFPDLPTSNYKPVADMSIDRVCNIQPDARPEVTLSTLVRAALGILIGRHTLSSDVIFGAVVSGRNADLENIQDLIGPTIATVPIRVQMPTGQLTSEYLRIQHRQTVEMIRFEQTGLQNISQINKSACDFQTLLVIQPADQQRRDNEVFGTWLTDLEQEGFTTYALTLQCSLPTASEGMHIKASFDSNVVTAWHMEKMLDEFNVILQQLVDADSQHTISDIDLLTPEDRMSLWSLNETVPQPVNECIHNLIRKRVNIQPNAIALSSWDGELTYKELDVLSDRFAQHILSLVEARDNNLVPICFEKSLWTVVAMLAAMKSGFGSVTLDINQPAARLKTIVQQINPPLILTSEAYAHLGPQLLPQNPAITIGPNQAADTKTSSDLDFPMVSPSSTIAVLFTSGSTGLPKGAAITHTNFATAIKYQAGTFGHGPGARIFAFASYSFDISWFDTLHALTSGSTLCIPSEAERKDDLEGSIARSGATVAFLTPSVARLLRPEALPSLRLLALGGEPQRGSDFSSWSDKVTKLSVYGPAETTVVSSAEDAHILEKRDMTLPRGIGLNTWLVDPMNNHFLSPIGSVGEIWLEGPLVGAGYIGDEARTNLAFVEDPAWILKGAGSQYPGRHGRMYKTGDLARYNADGTMSFTGRKDNQVKLRGQRIELTEVESHIRDVLAEEIKHVVVEVITMSRDETTATLVAFIEKSSVLRSSDLTSGEQKAPPTGIADTDSGIKPMVVSRKVMAELSARLPSYEVPQVYFEVRSMPRTINGKTDRKTLRAIGSRYSSQQLADNNVSIHQKAQPTDATGLALQRLFAQALRVKPESVGIDDNFFQLGGDSIAAMKLVGFARKEGITSLSVAQVFRHPTLRAQAQLHQNGDNVGTGGGAFEEPLAFSLLDSQVNISAICEEISESYGIDISTIEDVYPATPLQEGLMSLTLKRETTSDYVLENVLELSETDEFDLDVFKKAWQTTVDSTPILRTRIVQLADVGMVQVLLNKEEIQWHTTQDETSPSYVHKDKAMDLGQPLTRFALIEERGRRNPRWFVWTIHHSLYDAFSLPVMIRNATQTYLQATRPSRDEPVPTQGFSRGFASFIQYIKKGDRKDAEDFWKSCFSRNQATSFPPLPASISQPRTDMVLEQFCALSQQTHSVTTATLVRAALALLISRQTSSSEAVFGAIVSGRNAPIPGIDTIIAPTIATVPVFVRVLLEQTVDEYLTAVQQQAIEMIPYEQTGLQNISRLSDDARNACDFQTLLVVQPSAETPDDEDHLARSRFGTWHTSSEQEGFTTYALTIQCLLGEEGITYRVNYDSTVIEPWRMERLLVQLGFLTQQLSSAGPETKVGRIATLLPPEDNEVIWDWNNVVPTAVEKCVHDIVKERVQGSPHSPAVEAFDGNLTYQQLDSLSELVAHELVVSGVAPGTIVGLCFEKSLWTVIGLLGVLKTGAAFVFLDAETQPEARLRTIVEQANVRVICSSVARQSLSRSLTDKIVLTGPELMSRQSSQALHHLPQVDPSSPLYLVFTSGSTGQPKGACLSHRSFTSALHHQLSVIHMTSQSRIYDFASYSFDVAVHNVLAALAAGACLCVPSDTDRKTRLAESMEEFKANYVNLTSSVARLIDPAEVPTLKTMVLGGETVTLDVVDKWWNKVQLVNSLGPSECTTMSVISSSPKIPADVLRIGFGAGCVTWVVDPSNAEILLPVGQVGEMILEGPLLGSGYLNDADKTAAAVIENPSWLTAGSKAHPGRTGRLWKTGDLVRYDHDGSLHIIGRKDTQAKVRGQRLELEEVEHHLRSRLPEAKVVAEAVLTADVSSTLLAAFISIENSSTSQSKQQATPVIDQATIEKMSTVVSRLNEDLSQRLPPYMVPSLYIPLSAIPMTATAKTDRRQLRLLAETLSRDQLSQLRGLGAHGNKEPPSTKLGLILHVLWSKLLDVPESSIGADDSFFRLGGDSITAMKMVGEARKRGVNISVADVFRKQSISALVESQPINGHIVKPVEIAAPAPFSLVDPTTKDGVITSLLSLAPETQVHNISDILPVTDFQSQSIARNTTHYFWLDFKTNNVDPEHLRGSCQHLVDSYLVLRSVFVPFKQLYWQVVLRQQSIDFSTLTIDEGLDAACESMCSTDSREGVPVGTIPTSFVFLHNQIQGYRLVLRLSHAQYDGIALPIIFKSLVDIYRGDTIPVLPEWSTYLSHQVKQRPASSAYWKELLAGSKNSQVTTRALQSPGEPLSKITTEISISLPLLNDEFSLSSIVGAAWAVFLSLIAGEDDVVFGHLIAGRDAAIPGIQDIVAPCVNVIPVRIRLQMGQSTPAAIIKAFQEQLIASQHVGPMMGWEDIIQSCTDWPDDPVLGSVLQHQNIDEHPSFEIAGSQARLDWYDNRNDIPESVSVVSYPAVGTQFRIRTLASSHHMTLDTANRWIRCLGDILTIFNSAGNAPISRSSLDELARNLRLTTQA